MARLLHASSRILLWMAFSLSLVPGFPAFEAAAGAKTEKVVFLGDSLTEGLGVSESESYPQVVAEELRSKGKPIEAVNAGISGSTSASAPARVKWILKGKPDLIILALGANDGLRGLSVENLKKNLAESIRLARQAGVKVLLAGMKAPPNYGKEYTRAFERVYPELAKEFKLPLIPFLLAGVAGEKEMNQADQIHPNARGHRRMAKLVVQHLEPLL